MAAKILYIFSFFFCSMCKHIQNAQVSIRAPCCKKWFDCTKCHAESTSHELAKRFELVFGCKKCKKVFRKDLRDFEEQDEYCPHCDNHFYVEPESQLLLLRRVMIPSSSNSSLVISLLIPENVNIEAHHEEFCTCIHRINTQFLFPYLLHIHSSAPFQPHCTLNENECFNKADFCSREHSKQFLLERVLSLDVKGSDSIQKVKKRKE
mgnify:CR=1 FL=1